MVVRGCRGGDMQGNVRLWVGGVDIRRISDALLRGVLFLMGRSRKFKEFVLGCLRAMEGIGCIDKWLLFRT